ncbi:ABC transporter ATP-binding protein [Candidatus Viridilinea mediisalina]|uniref:ATP-binding protein n=1 Tax=Candidatus Viridilinea mediisalina TaxID=2024553 RepID=A0A2A6REA6_9CHLR|nr:ABC transporter ATP-binding protein [Candidatus Viridilinea mediisalina]PDW00781.1 ATP-binding protein [Candidatus Viridilinea mediisalina]
MHTTILQAEELTIGYRARRSAPSIVATQLNVALHAGEVVCLLGPNGVGKSTLLRTLVGMQPPLGGRVLLDGNDLSRLKPHEVARCLSVVLTERIEVGQLSAYALVALGRHPHTDWTGRLSQRDEEMVRWALEAVDAVKLAQRYVHELSDGERQRVMVARALAQEPLLMVLDEPTAFLDLPRRVEMMRLLRRLARETKRALLLSTHDLDLALRSADALWLLAPGGVLHHGAPEDLVLGGAFEAAFANDGINFDRQQGSFQVHPPAHQRAILRGNGLVGTWTARTLERVGCTLVRDGEEAPLQIAVLGDLHTPAWEIANHGDPPQRVTSLHALAALVRAAANQHGAGEADPRGRI